MQLYCMHDHYRFSTAKYYINFLKLQWLIIKSTCLFKDDYISSREKNWEGIFV